MRDIVINCFAGNQWSLAQLKTAFASPPAVYNIPARPGGMSSQQWYDGQIGGLAAPFGGRIVPAIASKLGIPLADVGRVAAVGFSEGGYGVGACLRAADAQRIDAAIAIDGIHTHYATGPGNKPYVSAAQLEPWIAYGMLAASTFPGGKLAVYTHSSIVPGTFVSTTESCAIIWDQVSRTAPANAISVVDDRLLAVKFPNPDYPSGYTVTAVQQPGQPYTWHSIDEGWFQQLVLNNFNVFGWKNKSAAGYVDHIFQAQVVLPYVLKYMLAPRWGTCGPVSGLGADGPALACTPGDGVGYNEQSGGALPHLYGPNEAPNYPKHVGLPGGPTGPAGSGGGQPPPPLPGGGGGGTAPPPTGRSTAAPLVVAAAVGAVVGYATARYALR